MLRWGAGRNALKVAVLGLLAAMTMSAVPAGASTAIQAKAGFSVGAGWMNLSQTELTKDLDAMQAARAKYLRLSVLWSQLEPTKDAYAWAKSPQPVAAKNLDFVIQGATARGIKVIGVVTTSPAWARPAGCTNPACAPARNTDYTAFLNAAVRRYSAAPYGVHIWEVWNMPNTNSFYMPTPDATKYTAMLKAAYPVIKTADTKATVLLGGLGAGKRYCTAPAMCIDPLTFLSQLYSAGAKGSFNGVDIHTVTQDTTGKVISPLTSSTANVFYNLPQFHNVMVANSDTGKIWAEIGYSSLEGVTEAQQSTWVGQAMNKWTSYSWTAGLVVYNMRDMPNENAGVLRADGSPKPVYTRFATLTAP